MKPFTLFAGLLIGTTLISVASANTLYRWKDSQGVMHYSDKRPPKGVKYVIEVVEAEVTQPQENAGPPATVAVEESSACKAARRNLQILSVQDADIMMDTNGDGDTEKLEPEELGKQKRLAEAQIQAYCVEPSSGGSATPPDVPSNASRSSET